MYYKTVVKTNDYQGLLSFYSQYCGSRMTNEIFQYFRILCGQIYFKFVLILKCLFCFAKFQNKYRNSFFEYIMHIECVSKI